MHSHSHSHHSPHPHHYPPTVFCIPFTPALVYFFTTCLPLISAPDIISRPYLGPLIGSFCSSLTLTLTHNSFSLSMASFLPRITPSPHPPESVRLDERVTSHSSGCPNPHLIITLPFPSFAYNPRLTHNGGPSSADPCTPHFPPLRLIALFFPLCIQLDFGWSFSRHPSSFFFFMSHISFELSVLW